MSHGEFLEDAESVGTMGLAVSSKRGVVPLGAHGATFVD